MSTAALPTGTIHPRLLFAASFQRGRMTPLRRLRLAKDEAPDPSVIPLEYRGGRVIFSVNVNIGIETFTDRIRSLLQTFLNRLRYKHKVDVAVSEVMRGHGKDTGWGISRPFPGRYKPLIEPKVKKETAIQVEIAGISSDALRDIAEALRQSFHQESVLVHDENERTTFFKVPGGTRPIVSARRRRLVVGVLGDRL